MRLAVRSAAELAVQRAVLATPVLLPPASQLESRRHPGYGSPEPHPPTSHPREKGTPGGLDAFNRSWFSAVVPSFIQRHMQVEPINTSPYTPVTSFVQIKSTVGADGTCDCPCAQRDVEAMLEEKAVQDAEIQTYKDYGTFN